MPYLEISNPMDYKAALYIRLSKEDDNELESESVTYQRSMLLGFAKQHRLYVYDTYVDDGWSGTSFDRPDFRRMIADIEDRQVNMVITKDMSRLGRDYIQTGYYMEKYFPENRVRYISLLDGVDTGVDSTANEITPFRAIMNDMYAKDISKKIKSVKHDKQKKGLFIGGKAVYGYRLSEAEKNRLEIDEEAAAVVKRIFTLAAGGRSCRQIASQLNRENIPPPSVYAGLIVTRKGPYHGMWSSERISSMLQNQTYIGNMVQGKTKKISYKSGKCLHVDKNDWIVVKNTHEPLIDKDIFDKVQMQVSSRNRTRERTHDYLLKGLIHCHECGYPLSVVNRPNAKGKDTLYFICRTYQRFTSARKCTCHSIKEETVTAAVLEQVDEICSRYISRDTLTEAADQALKKIEAGNDTAYEIISLDEKIEALTANLDRMYMDKLSGILDEKDFTRIYCKVKEERAALEGKKKALQALKKTNPKEREKKARELVERFLKTKNRNRELIVSLIEKVELTEDKQVFIHFRFRQLEAINTGSPKGLKPIGV